MRMGADGGRNSAKQNAPNFNDEVVERVVGGEHEATGGAKWCV